MSQCHLRSAALRPAEATMYQVLRCTGDELRVYARKSASATCSRPAHTCGHSQRVETINVITCRQAISCTPQRGVNGTLAACHDRVARTMSPTAISAAESALSTHAQPVLAWHMTVTARVLASERLYRLIFHLWLLVCYTVADPAVRSQTHEISSFRELDLNAARRKLTPHVCGVSAF